MKTPNSRNSTALSAAVLYEKFCQRGPASNTPSPPCGPTWFFQEPPSPFAVHMVYGCPLNKTYT